MGIKLSMNLMQVNTAATQEDLAVCNQATVSYGLSLTQEQMQGLVERRQAALRATGRVEFGRGVLREIVLGFCDSPFLIQNSYEETVAGIQDVFYRRKEDAELGEPVADDDLIEALRDAFDNEAAGSVEALEALSLKSLRAYAARKQAGDYDEQTQNEYFEKESAHDGAEEHTHDELSRMSEDEQWERPGNDYAAGFYDGYNELYRIGFDSNSRIGGSGVI